MDTTTLTTVVIIQFEILLVLLIACIILFLKNRRYQQKTKQLPPANNSVSQKPASLAQLIKNEVKKTRQQLDSLENKTDISALKNRIDFFESEITLLDTDTDQNEAFWLAVEQHYSTPELNQDSPGNNKEQVYLSRIENLEKFRDLFIQVQKQLADSFLTINNLKEAMNKNNQQDGLENMEKAILQLTTDKEQLQNQLAQANERLESSIEEMKSELSEHDNQELEAIKEENEFLVQQIQFLLKQEVENSDSMLKQINSLEKTILEKTTECEQLKTQSAKH